MKSLGAYSARRSIQRPSHGGQEGAFTRRRVLTKGGFSKSRRNLAPEAFLELNDIVWRGFYQQVDYLGYHGHKLLAVDGTFLNLPNHASIHKEFGIRDMGRGQNKDVPKSMCLLSMRKRSGPGDTIRERKDRPACTR